MAYKAALGEEVPKYNWIPFELVYPRNGRNNISTNIRSKLTALYNVISVFILPSQGVKHDE